MNKRERRDPREKEKPVAPKRDSGIPLELPLDKGELERLPPKKREINNDNDRGIIIIDF